MLSFKGFIGPIGDDLPSLIPILFGLLIFFSSFSSTFSSFDSKNRDFASDLSVMEISRVLQSNSYIFSKKNFDDLCKQVGNVGLSFVAGISSDAIEGKSVESVFDVSFFKDSFGNEYYCTNTNFSGDSVSDFISEEDISDKKVVARIFPIVVEDNKIAKPLHLFVVAWRN